MQDMREGRAGLRDGTYLYVVMLGDEDNIRLKLAPLRLFRSQSRARPIVSDALCVCVSLVVSLNNSDAKLNDLVNSSDCPTHQSDLL